MASRSVKAACELLALSCQAAHEVMEHFGCFFTRQQRWPLICVLLSDSRLRPAAVLLDQGASAWTSPRILIPIRLAVPDDQVDIAMRFLSNIKDTQLPEYKE